MGSNSAKNPLKNVFGYSPNQLAFGKNPNLPTAIGSEPSALEGVSSRKLIADHLNCLHTTRKAFIESEASDKIERAFLWKARTATSLVYEVGDLVYYKRNYSKRWRGPDTVIGKDRNQICVKHGGSYLRVNPCHIRPVKRSEPSGKIQEEGEEASSVEDAGRKHQAEIEQTCESEQEDKDVSEERGENVISVAPNVTQGQDLISDSEQICDSKLNDDELEDQQDIPEEENPTVCSGKVPVKGNKILYQLPETEDWLAATVIATGKNKWWINVRDSKDKAIRSVNLEELKASIYVEEEVLLCTQLLGKNNVDVLEAKIRELQNWKDHDVFTEIADDGQNGITVHWIVSEKSIDGNSSIKARLVARGFEEGEDSSIRRDSPTCMKESLRLTLVTALSKGWRIGSLDIKSAFLQGQKIE